MAVKLQREASHGQAGDTPEPLGDDVTTERPDDAASLKSSSTPFMQVPQEIADCVIDETVDDILTLRHCSLVCRGWRSTAQHQLFNSIEVDVSQRPLPTFVEFFSSSLDASDADLRAPVSLYVRHLTVRSAGKNNPNADIITIDNLHEILHCFPRLRTLTLEALRIELDATQLPQNPHPLARVSLKDVIVQDRTHDQLLRALTALCAPRALHLSNVGLKTDTDPEAGPAAASQTVETLALRVRAMPPSFLRMFARGGALRRLDVACFVPGDVRALAGFLEAAGGRLEHFALDLSRFLAKVPTSYEEDLRRVALDGCTSLRELTLRITFLAEPWASLPFNGTGLDVASRILASAPPTLRTLTVALALDGDASSEDAFYRPLEESFNTRLSWLKGLRAARPELRELRWIWSYARKVGKPRTTPVDPILQAKLTKLVRENLAEVDAKGILRFVDGDEDIWG